MFKDQFRKWAGAQKPEHVKRTHKHLSIIYFFLTWNLCGLVLYKVLKERLPKSKKERIELLRSTAGADTGIKYHIEGFSKITSSDLKGPITTDKTSEEDKSN